MKGLEGNTSGPVYTRLPHQGWEIRIVLTFNVRCLFRQRSHGYFASRLYPGAFSSRIRAQIRRKLNRFVIYTKIRGAKGGFLSNFITTSNLLHVLPINVIRTLRIVCHHSLFLAIPGARNQVNTLGDTIPTTGGKTGPNNVDESTTIQKRGLE